MQSSAALRDRGRRSWRRSCCAPAARAASAGCAAPRHTAPRSACKRGRSASYEDCRLHVAAVLRHEVHANIGEVRRVAEEGPLKEAGEIRNRVRADENLVVADFRRCGQLRADRFRDVRSSRRRVLDGGASIVTRNVVSLARGSMRNCTSCSAGSASAIGERQARARSRKSEPARGLSKSRASASRKGCDPPRVARGSTVRRAIAQQMIGRPRRDGDGDEERGEHRDRNVDRDRPHVRPHHPGHEEHRKKRKHDGDASRAPSGSRSRRRRATSIASRGASGSSA